MADAGRLLEADRARTLARIAALTGTVASIDEATGFTAIDDEHDPEGTTLSLERSQTGALLADARDHLAEVDAALGRLAAGTYGVCEVCDSPIAAGRLEARPAARRCVACAV